VEVNCTEPSPSVSIPRLHQQKFYNIELGVKREKRTDQGFMT